MREAANVLSRLLIRGNDNTPLKDDLTLHAIDGTHKRNTHICVINTDKDDVVPLHNDNSGVSLDTTPTESQLILEQAKAP